MAGQFRVTEDELRALSSKISQVNSSIQGEVKRLDGVISGIASGWQGQAATSYNRLQQQWNEDARKMNNILNDIKEAVDSTRQNYSATEEQQNADVSKIMSDFG